MVEKLSESRFRITYRDLSVMEAQLVADIKRMAEGLAKLIDLAPTGRERALAMTKLEESVMWATKSITK
jgi:hypothetical protein